MLTLIAILLVLILLAVLYPRFVSTLLGVCAFVIAAFIIYAWLA